MESLAVGVLFLLALGWVIFRIYKGFCNPADCCSGCSGCMDNTRKHLSCGRGNEHKMLATVFFMLVSLAVAGPVFAEVSDAQVQALIEQNQALTARLQKVEAELSKMKKEKSEPSAEVVSGANAGEETLTPVMALAEAVELHGLLEAEAFSRRSYNNVDESDITLATMELGMDVKIHEFVKGHVLLLWEEDDTEPVDLDEGYITIGNTEKFPVFMNVGKMYVPFGVFESNMIQDSLTLELAETRESAVQIGFETLGFYGSVFAYNGDVKEESDGEDDTINSLGLNIGYKFEADEMGLDISTGYVSNMADSDTLSDAVSESVSGELDSLVGGAYASLVANYGSFGLIGEYVSATSDFEDGEFDFREQGARPAAWNLEGSYAFDLMGTETTFALGYQGTREAVGLELPRHRYLAGLKFGIFKYTTLGFEYLHDKDYSEKDGGTDEDADQFTTQLAIEF